MSPVTLKGPEPLDARSSGVLLHISSLPSPYGIGDLGASAYSFVDYLSEAGQRVWQVLPINPTLGEAGDSPYFSGSALAGNPLFIDLEALVADGLLHGEELATISGEQSDSVDFSAARALKLPLLGIAESRFRENGLSDDFADFLVRQSHWLNDHALFTALAKHFAKGWAEWPEPLRRRDRDALNAAAVAHEQAIGQEQVFQYFFARQWQKLRHYCHQKGVSLFGDMPIYVAYDSVDVWANSAVFQLDEALQPTRISGVPPDYFSATGQLWRNPVYNWEVLQATGFAWWQRRIANSLEHYDLLRIDHFRGLVQYWGVPADADTAMHGQWYPVPTRELFDSLTQGLGVLPLVVEDLGTITDDVVAARDHFGYPGMAVLQFAFGNDDPFNPHRPENHSENSVVYLGTHDNSTGKGWLLEEVDDEARQRLSKVLGPDWQSDAVFSLIKLLLQSRPRLAIITAQDLLELPGSARMNDPAKPEKNWHWRLSTAQLDSLPRERLRQMSQKSGRC